MDVYNMFIYTYIYTKGNKDVSFWKKYRIYYIIQIERWKLYIFTITKNYHTNNKIIQ